MTTTKTLAERLAERFGPAPVSGWERIRRHIASPEGQAQIAAVMAAAPPWPPGAVISTCPHCNARYANDAICCKARGLQP